MHKRKGFFALLMAVVAGLWWAGTATAGPGSIEVQTVGDITIKMGAQVRLIPTGEVNRDFGLSNHLSSSEEAKAANLMKPLGDFGSSTRSHLTEAAGAVKDDYIRGENRLFFNFAQDKNWDVYMALESDTTLDRTSADRTDFVYGKQSQQFGIERLMATFNMPWINSRFQAGWDALGVDIGYGGLVYGDDDPGMGIVGSANGFKWEARYLKKDENEAGYGDYNIAGYIDGTQTNNLGSINPIGSPNQGRDADRTFYYGKLGYSFGPSFVEGFYMLDRNQQQGDVNHEFAGLAFTGTYGIVKPVAEVVYSFGKADKFGGRNYDIDSWAAYADVAFDLGKAVGLQKFEPHVGFFYLQGDDDPTDRDLKGFTPAVGITRFTPRFGSEQSISFDGNPLFGQILYSIFPTYYGSISGGGINGAAKLDNPGFMMVGGGLKTGYDRWTYITNVMAMWFDQSEPVETFYNVKTNIANFNAKIDDFMGIEWNNEVRYRLYDAVTIKGGAAFLFPGNGAKDITKALDAYARGVTFDQGRSSDDVSMRFAAELLWYF